MNASLINLNATGIWISLFIFLYIFLAYRVIMLRRGSQIGLGTGENKDLLKAVRIHGNYSEYIPLLILAISILEMRGLRTPFIHLMFAAGFLGRLMILQGISKSVGFSYGRFIGNAMTFVVLLIAGIWNLALSF